MGDYLKGGLLGEGLEIFLVVGYISVFLLISYFFYATYTSNKMLVKDRQIFFNYGCFFFPSSMKH